MFYDKFINHRKKLLHFLKLQYTSEKCLLYCKSKQNMFYMLIDLKKLFFAEKMEIDWNKFYVYKHFMCFYRRRETNIIQVYYTYYLQGTQFFFFLQGPEDPVSWMTIELKQWMGKFSLLYVIIAPKWSKMILCKRQGLETLKVLP